MSISSLCSTAKNRGLWRGLDVFCLKYDLAEHIKVMGRPMVGVGGAQGQAVGTGLWQGEGGGERCVDAQLPLTDLGPLRSPTSGDLSSREVAGRPSLWVPQLAGGTGAPLPLLTSAGSAGAADLCQQMPDPIPVVLCRCCWKRSPCTICAQRCGSAPCLPSET